MNITFLKLLGKVKGIVSGIPYVERLKEPDWSAYFGTYEGQKYGPYDTQSCWDFAGVEVLETVMEWLWKSGAFDAETVGWFKDNGFIDSDGDFYFSRRWAAIISGAKDNGNDQDDFWAIASVAGVVPNWMLPFSVADAGKDLTRDAFVNDYFNPNRITLKMELMGKELLKRIKIQRQNVGRRWTTPDMDTLKRALRQSSLEIGVPVAQDGSWNMPKVTMPYGRYVADHAVELYKIDEINHPDFPYFIYDSYEPHLKQLSKDYYIPIVTMPWITAIPRYVPETSPTYLMKNPFTSLWQWIIGLKDSLRYG